MEPLRGSRVLHDAALLRRIIEVQQEIACADLTTSELYQLVADRAVELTGADGAVVEEVEGRELFYAAASGSMAAFQGERQQLDNTVTGIAVRTRTPQICRDAENDPRTSPVYSARFGLRSFVVVPFERYGEVAAVIIVVSKHVDGIGQEAVDLLAMMAELIGARMASAAAVDTLAQRSAAHDQVKRAMQRQADELSSLAAARRAVLAGDNPRRSVVTSAFEVSGAAFVALVEPTGDNTLVATATAGAAGTGLQIPTDPPTLLVEVWRSQRARITTDLHSEPMVNRWLLDRLEELCGCRLGGAAFFPLNTPEGCLGVLGVAWPVGPTDAVRLQMLGVLEVLAQEAAIAVEREDLRHQLTQLAATDPLTGLANRRRWDDWLSDEMRRSRRSASPLSIGLVDLDRFKVYNDTHGHAAGDALLAACAHAWQAELRETDLLARYGGEEFTVGLTACGSEDALARLQRLRLATPGGETCSIGVATWDGVESGAEVLARADSALYGAKSSGRNRVQAQPAG